jgi:hypothetical protein
LLIETFVDWKLEWKHNMLYWDVPCAGYVFVMMLCRAKKEADVEQT